MPVNGRHRHRVDMIFFLSMSADVACFHLIERSKVNEKPGTDKPTGAYTVENNMKKNLTIVIVAVLFLFQVMPVLAASDKCKVIEAEGNTLVLECKHETDSFERGTTLKIKTERKSSAIEGC